MELFTKLFGRVLVFVYHCFDRIVIHGYLSGLSRPEQVVYFFRQVVGVSTLTKGGALGAHRRLSGLGGGLCPQRAIHLIQVTSTGCGLAAVSPNQTFIPHWRRSHGLLNQSIEEFGPAAGLASVESERELVEVIIQMLAGDSTLVGAQQPPLQQGRHTVHARQQDRSRFATSADHPGSVQISERVQSFVALPSVCDHGGPGHDRFLHESMETARRSIRHPTQPDTPDAFSVRLGRHYNQGLVSQVPAASPGLYATHIGFIYFDLTGKAVTAGPHHRATELVQPSPSRLVTAQSQATLQAQGTDTDLLVRHIPHGSEPRNERSVCPLEDRPNRRRGVPMTASTLKPSTSPGRPSALTTARRTPKTLWPPKLHQVNAATLLGSKTSFEFGHSPRKILRLGAVRQMRHAIPLPVAVT